MSAQRFCDQCGEPVTAPAKFCAACGAKVEPPDLAVRSTPEPATTIIDPAGAPTTVQQGASRPSNRRALALTVVGLIALVAAIAGISAMTGDDNTSADADVSVSDNGDEIAALQTCVDRWNSEDNRIKSVGAMRGVGEGYVSIGFAEDFPDKCLITVAYPTVDRSLQFIEAGEGSVSGPYGMPQQGTLASLPESTKQWNAQIDPTGTVKLGRTSSTSDSGTDSQENDPASDPDDLTADRPQVGETKASIKERFGTSLDETDGGACIWKNSQGDRFEVTFGDDGESGCFADEQSKATAVN